MLHDWVMVSKQGWRELLPVVDYIWQNPSIKPNSESGKSVRKQPHIHLVWEIRILSRLQRNRVRRHGRLFPTLSSINASWTCDEGWMMMLKKDLSLEDWTLLQLTTWKYWPKAEESKGSFISHYHHTLSKIFSTKLLTFYVLTYQTKINPSSFLSKQTLFCSVLSLHLQTADKPLKRHM